MRQQAFEFRTWGGRRARAGRRPNGERAGVSHLRRPALSHHHPVHVTLRVQSGLPSLRVGQLFARVQKALAAGQDRFGFRLVHFSVQSNHLHLIAEAANRRSLSRGLQGLNIRLARAINSELQRRGRVFADRYHARALQTPQRAALAARSIPCRMTVSREANSAPERSTGVMTKQSVPGDALRMRPINCVTWRS